MNFSESDKGWQKMDEGSVCEHLADFKIHDVKRNLMFDVSSNPTLHGSGNGSVENMLLHNKLAASTDRESCSGSVGVKKV